MSKKAWLSLLICHLFLFNGVFPLSIYREIPETKAPQTMSAPTTRAEIKQTSAAEAITTQLPPKGVIQDGKHEDAEIRLNQRESLEKPLPKKRGVLDELYRGQSGNFDETGYDTNEDAVADESFSASRADFEEKPFYKYSDSAFVTDDGYFENEGRTKRTADLDDLYDRPKTHGRTIELTQEEIMALLNFIQQTRSYRENHPDSWPYEDNNVGSIEADMRDEDIYKDRIGLENSFGSYEPGVKRYPINRRRRNSLLEERSEILSNKRDTP